LASLIVFSGSGVVSYFAFGSSLDLVQCSSCLVYPIILSLAIYKGDYFIDPNGTVHTVYASKSICSTPKIVAKTHKDIVIRPHPIDLP